MTPEDREYMNQKFQWLHDDLHENFVKKTAYQESQAECYKNVIVPMQQAIARNKWVIGLFTAIGIGIGRYLPVLLKAVF